MILKVLLLASFFQMEGTWEPRDLKVLDEARLRKTLEQTYGEFMPARPSVWKVSIEGKTENWTWNGYSFECPKTEPASPNLCEEWTPQSFRWFLSGQKWLEPWIQMRADSFFLGRPEIQARDLDKSVEASLQEDSEIDPNAPEEDELEFIPEWEANRMASERWNWTDREGKNSRFYISLRNQWIERVDPDSLSSEYLKWERKKKWSKPTLTKLVLDRNGKRVSFELVREIKPKKKK